MYTLVFGDVYCKVVLLIDSAVCNAQDWISSMGTSSHLAWACPKRQCGVRRGIAWDVPRPKYPIDDRTLHRLHRVPLR